MTSGTAGTSRAPLIERARAIKARCYAAWHSDPAEAARCADELDALAGTPAEVRDAAEVRALADWTRAIADIATGDLAGAIERLECARSGFASLGLAADAAETQIPRIMALSLLGRFAEASDCALAARDALLELGDLRGAARVVLNMGSLCYSQDRYAEAAEHYRRAAVWFARVGDREHSVLADIARGDACSFLGDLAEAEALYRRAAQRATAHGLHVIASTATQALAELELARGNFREALTGLERATRDFAGLGLPLLQAQAERALADTYLELNLVTEAEALYADVSRAVGESSEKDPWLWVQRARIAAVQGWADAAATALDQAAELFTQHDNAVGLAEVALARAAAAMGAGGWSVARAHAAEAARCLRDLELPRAHAELTEAAADLQLGHVRAARGRLDVLLADPATPLPVRERAWLWHGRTWLAEGLAEAARASFERAVELAELGLAALPSDDYQRGYLDARAGAYEELLRLALHEAGRAAAGAVQAGRASGRSAPTGSGSTAEVAGDDQALAVLAALERLRARTLAFQLSLSARRGEGARNRDRAWEADRAQLDWIYRRTHRLLREDADASLPGGLETERLALEQRLLEHRRRARLAVADPDAVEAIEGLNWGQLRERFSGDRALVAYGQLDDEIFAVTLSAGQFRVHRHLADVEAFRGATAALRLQFDTQRLGAGALERHRALLLQRTRCCLAALYDLIWRPFEAAVAEAAEVGIVPTAVLGALPFAALWDGERHLVERHALYHLASVTAAAASPDPPAFEHIVLAADTRRLAGTQLEIRGLQGIWPDSSLLLGPAMSRDGLRAHAPAADLLHLACHGQFRADSPLFSALFLDDGAFTAFEIERLPLARGPMVVLSACEGAVRDGARGDEALGLVRAFLVAGASRVMAGLWQVDDAGTSEWMVDLHRALRAAAAHAGPSRPTLSHVLAAVQRENIANDLHPFNWAAFALHGGR